MGVSLLLLFTQLFTFVHTGTLAQVLGHVTFSISYVVVIVRGRLFSIGRSYEEAAADLGASPGAALCLVLLPLLLPAIVASAAIVFAISIDDFVISQWLSNGANSTTVPMLIYDATRATPLPSTDGLATVIMLITLITVVAGVAVSPAVHARRGRPRLGGRRRRRVRDVDGRSTRASIGYPWRPISRGAGVAGGEVKLDSVGEAVRRRHGRGRHRPGDARCGVLLDAGPVRLRQDDDAADDRRLRAADQRPDPAGRRGHGVHAAAQAQREHGVPELRAVPAPDRAGQRRVRAAPRRRRPRTRSSSGWPRRWSWCS